MGEGTGINHPTQHFRYAEKDQRWSCIFDRNKKIIRKVEGRLRNSLLQLLNTVHLLKYELDNLDAMTPNWLKFCNTKRMKRMPALSMFMILSSLSLLS